MAKKPASAKPIPEGAAEVMATLDAGHEAAATMPTDAHLKPMPGIDTPEDVEDPVFGIVLGDPEILEIPPDMPNPYDFPPSREEFDALKARVDAFAAHHLQTYGKVI